MKSSLFLVWSLVLLVITGWGPSLPTEHVATGTAAIESVDASNDDDNSDDQGSSNGPDLQKFITYPQIYPSPDGETHFREVTVPVTLGQRVPPTPPFLGSRLSPATAFRWAVFPKGWGLDDLRSRTFHNVSARRFVSVRKGSVVIIASDGEKRRFERGDVFEALDVPPSKGRIAYSEDGCELFLTDEERITKRARY